MLGGKVIRWLHAWKHVVCPAVDVFSLIRRKKERRDNVLVLRINDPQRPISGRWIEDLATDLEPGLTRVEWLIAAPARKSIPALDAQAFKIAVLRDIGSDCCRRTCQMPK